MNISDLITTMNTWGRDKVPFLFAVDFEMEQPWILPLSEVDDSEILYDIRGFTNAASLRLKENLPLTLQKHPLPFENYQTKFDVVHKGLSYGDSYLTNLTIKTEVSSSASLRDIFLQSKAAYKLLYKDQFLVFSPETFIRIDNGKIFSFPMKGTIDAMLPNAREKILGDGKELAEHVTIVDLIRNDLSQVAEHVAVTRFRFVEEIRTNHKNLLQVSSEITGTLPFGYDKRLGDILVTLLPAGSVSGAPKNKTLEIIREAEKEKRGFYTGVFGYFNGLSLDSGVMIRFIETDGEKYFYRSGGGITTQSVVSSEYQEAIDKVYVPVD
jgi:para-aminobenzoate synthetase component 1